MASSACQDCDVPWRVPLQDITAVPSCEPAARELESQALQELAPLTRGGKTLSPGERVQNSGQAYPAVGCHRLDNVYRAPFTVPAHPAV